MDGDEWYEKRIENGKEVELKRLHGQNAGMWVFEHFVTALGSPQVIRVEHWRNSRLLAHWHFPDDLDDDALVRKIRELLDWATAREAVNRLRSRDLDQSAGM